MESLLVDRSSIRSPPYRFLRRKQLKKVEIKVNKTTREEINKSKSDTDDKFVQTNKNSFI